VYIPEEKRRKSALIEKSIPCWFWDYVSRVKGYQLQVKSNKSILISKNVIFRENDFKILKSKVHHDGDHNDDISLLSNLLRPSLVLTQNSIPCPPQPPPRLELEPQPRIVLQQPQNQLQNQDNNHVPEIPSTPSQGTTSKHIPFITPSTSNTSGHRHTSESLLKLQVHYGLNPESDLDFDSELNISQPIFEDAPPSSPSSSSIPINFHHPKRTRKAPDRLIATMDGKSSKKHDKPKPWIYATEENFSKDSILAMKQLYKVLTYMNGRMPSMLSFNLY
jgi:hypothetical protein